MVQQKLKEDRKAIILQFKSKTRWGSPSGSAAVTALPTQGARAQSLVKELDPVQSNKETIIMKKAGWIAGQELASWETGNCFYFVY